MKTAHSAARAAVALAATLAGCLSLRAQEFPVQTRTLENGLKILVHEDRTIPNVALYVFYRIGSRNERPGTTGLSHFFEHMMFNGAKKYGPGEFDRTMEAAGGANNAFTTRDLTVYQDWFPRSALEVVFDLEADRIQHLSFDPEMVESERGVVANERRLSVDNNNFGALNEALWAGAFLAHPYQWPVVGWMSDIQSWGLEDLKSHFSAGYSPSNALLVAVGAVSPNELFDLAERTLGPLPARQAPPPVKTVEPVQAGERRLEVRRLAQLPLIMEAYHVPASRSEDTCPLNLLQTILFTGQSSRLYQSLVDKQQLALFVGGGTDLSFDPSLFTVTTQPRPGVEAAALESALHKELERVASEGVTDRELQKAKNIRLAEFYRDIRSIDGKAQQLGAYEVYFGDYTKLFSAAADFEKVTLEDVQRVAKTYLTASNRTVVTLIPEKAPEKTETPQ